MLKSFVLFTLVILCCFANLPSATADVLAGGWWNAPLEDLYASRNRLCITLGEPQSSHGTVESGEVTILIDGWQNATQEELVSAKSQIEGHILNLGGELPFSSTPSPTFTPQPTYTPTPLPTFTPQPTFTPTPSPESTATVAPAQDESLKSNERFTLFGKITWNSTENEVELAVIENGYSKGLIYELLKPSGMLSYEQGQVFGCTSLTAAFEFDRNGLYHISIGYKASRTSFATVYDNLKNTYGDHSIEKYVYEGGDGETHSMDAYMWTLSDAELFLSPSSLTNSLSDIEKGIGNFVVNIKHKKPDTYQYDNSFVIRNNVSFGMSKEDVQKCEGSKPDQEIDNNLLYSSEAGGLDCALVYYFDSNNGLYRVGYVFSEEHSEENLYVSDYDDINDELISKYGDPFASGINWINDLYENKPDKLGFAISAGHASCYSYWFSDNVYIMHSLAGDNYDFAHVIVYEDPNNTASSDSKSHAEGL